jgi:hypothetical protein
VSFHTVRISLSVHRFPRLRRTHMGQMWYVCNRRPTVVEVVWLMLITKFALTIERQLGLHSHQRQAKMQKQHWCYLQYLSEFLQYICSFAYVWLEITLTCFGLTIFSKRQLDVISDDPYSTALILSGYDSSDPYSPQQSAKCELQARWPANYGDVYFGADGCLYDSKSNKIFNQCCSTPDINNSGPTVNPYFDPRPAASCQRTPGIGFVHFEIYSKGWITDNGDALHKQAKGCGLMTGWSFGTNTDIQTDGSSAHIERYRPQYLAMFNLPATFKSGCVGRAIASAGGPKGVDC